MVWPLATPCQRRWRRVFGPVPLGDFSIFSMGTTLRDPCPLAWVRKIHCSIVPEAYQTLLDDCLSIFWQFLCKKKTLAIHVFQFNGLDVTLILNNWSHDHFIRNSDWDGVTHICLEHWFAIDLLSLKIKFFRYNFDTI